MKLKNYIYFGIAVLVILFMAAASQAQTRVEFGNSTSLVEPGTKAQLKDSVEKYETLSFYYADKDSSDLAIKCYDKSRDFSIRLQSIETAKRDSNYKSILRRKYKINLP